MGLGGAVVSTHELAVRLGMVAVWGLRETGIIALEPYEAKRLMVKTHGVHAHLLGPPPPHNGIENKILTQWFRGTFAPSGEDVGQGFRWIPMSTNPHAVVLAEAINDVVACGALNRVPLERGVGQRPRGTPATQMQPLPDRIDALRERAEAFRGRWTQFAHTETALFRGPGENHRHQHPPPHPARDRHRHRHRHRLIHRCYGRYAAATEAGN